MGDRPTEKLQFKELTTAPIVIGIWNGDRLKMRIKVEAVIFAKNLRIGKSNKVNHWP